MTHHFPKKPQNTDWQDYPTGYVSGVHGIAGNILVSLFNFPIINIKNLQTLRLYTKNNQVIEHKIKSATVYKKTFIINCGLENRNQAEDLKGSQLWLNKSFLLTQSSGFILQFLGWKLFDTTSNKLYGQIVDFGFNGAQYLLIIKTLAIKNKKQLYFDIPFFKELKHQIITDKQQLNLALTKGLDEFTYEV